MTKPKIRYNVKHRSAQIMFRVTEEQAEWIKNQSEEMGISRSSLMQRLVEAEMDRDKQWKT